MVEQVNATEVSDADRLSDHVQHYDREAHVMENAEKRESRLEKEMVETKVARKSIHERLASNKEKSAAQKAVKATEKTRPKRSQTEVL